MVNLRNLLIHGVILLIVLGFFNVFPETSLNAWHLCVYIQDP